MKISKQELWTDTWVVKVLLLMSLLPGEGTQTKQNELYSIIEYVSYSTWKYKYRKNIETSTNNKKYIIWYKISYSVKVKDLQYEYQHNSFSIGYIFYSFVWNFLIFSYLKQVNSIFYCIHFYSYVFIPEVKIWFLFYSGKLLFSAKNKWVFC